MKSSNRRNSLEDAYFQEDFDYQKLKTKYEETINDLGWYFDICAKSSDIYKCQWAGKSGDLKKHGDDAFPYEGASDTEVYLARQKIDEAISFEMNALKRSQIRAFPRNAGDIQRSAEVSTLLKYFRDQGIRDFSKQMEQASRWGKTKGVMVTYCGWRKSKTPYLMSVDLEEIAASGFEDFAEIIADEGREDEAIAILQSFENWDINENRAKKALKELRRSGVAEIPLSIEDVSEPLTRTFSPDADFIMPSHVMDVQDSPEIHLRMLMTPTEVLNNVENGDWDKGWAEYLIENHTGMSRSEFNAPHGFRGYNSRGSSRKFGSTTGNDARDIIEVIWTWEKRIDPIDGAMGVYLTIWSPDTDEPEGVKPYGVRKLLSGRRNYPFVVTPIAWEEKTIYDVTPWPILLQGPQKNMKFTRDSVVDEISYQVSPTMLVPPGSGEWDKVGPGAKVQVRMGQKPEWLTKPSNTREGTALEQYFKQEADELVGFGSMNGTKSDLMPQRIEFHVSKTLEHAQKVLKMTYEAFKSEGPDEMFIRVTGKPEPLKFIRKEGEEEMDVSVSFNSIYNDPDKVETMLESLYRVQANSRSGRINSEAIEDIALNAIDPMLADLVLVSTEQGQAKILKEVTEDISKMAAGIQVPSPTDAPELRLNFVEEYKQSETGAFTLQQNQGLAFLLQEYENKLRFQYEQQVQNPQRGLLGGDPASMGNVNMEQLQE